jgi:hypothetical protein
VQKEACNAFKLAETIAVRQIAAEKY